MALSLLAVMACSSDENFSNKGYNASNKLQNILIKPSVDEETKTLEAAIAKPTDRDVSFQYNVDPTLLEAFNTVYKESAIILPEDHYSLEDSEVIIKAGMVRSSQATVNFTSISTLDRDEVYVLPVSIVSSDIALLKSSKTTYFVFKAAALINVVSDIEKNYLTPTWSNPGVVNKLSELTIESYINVRDFDNGEISTLMGIEGSFLIRFGDANFERNQIQVATSSGNFPGRDSSKGIPTNEWVHIAITFDKGQVKIYTNGKLQSDGSVGLRTVNLGVGGIDGFHIGYSYNADRYLNGLISECRIWNIIRTEEQIKSSVFGVDPNSEGLVAYWKFDEGAGNIVKDKTNNGNDLTANTDLKWVPVSLPASGK